MFTQVVGQNGGRHAKGVVFAISVDAWGSQQQFARVNEVLMLRVAFKAVPAFARHEVEESQVVGNLFGRPGLPRFTVNLGGHKRTNVVAVIQNQLTRFDAVRDAVHPHIAARLPFVHPRVDVQCGKQRVERAGGRVHHKGIVEAFMRDITLLTFDMTIFFMDL